MITNIILLPVLLSLIFCIFFSDYIRVRLKLEGRFAYETMERVQTDGAMGEQLRRQEKGCKTVKKKLHKSL